jgi:hypothetical protein
MTMLRKSRIFLLAALCSLPSLASAQQFPSGDEKQPAPGEPNGAAADASEDSQNVERFDRRVAPIEGTAPADVDLGEATDLGQPTQVPPQSPGGEGATGRSDATDGTPRAGDDGDLPAAPGEPTEAAARPDLQAEFQKLRDEIDRRLVALERRLDEQTARIEAIDATAIAAARPAEGAGEMNAEQAQQRQDQVAQLRQDLEQLRIDVGEQLREVAGAPAGETTTAARPVVTVEAHRLRIHNTTGVEQPISINGVQWTVRADEWSSVPIPRGPVTVHRPGYEPLEIANEQIDWQSDRRGYYFDYDLDEHRVAQPAGE